MEIKDLPLMAQWRNGAGLAPWKAASGMNGDCFEPRSDQVADDYAVDGAAPAGAADGITLPVTSSAAADWPWGARRDDRA